MPQIRGMPGHQMELVFQTDGQTQHEGFQVHVETRKCGGVFDDTFGGYVASPNYPISNYPNDEYCFWLLLAPSGDVIAYEFFVFDLYGPTSTHECEHVDWLELYNGPRMVLKNSESKISFLICYRQNSSENRSSPNSPKINRFCSSNKPKLNSVAHTGSNSLIALFYSDKDWFQN